MDLDPRILRTKKDVSEAALEILLEQGWSAVTHGAVAKASGYSRGTIYTHWPTALDLVRDAFVQYQQMPHFENTGDLRADLMGEMRSYVKAMTDYRLDRALAMLAEKSQVDNAVEPIRDKFVEWGEELFKESLSGQGPETQMEAALLMLCGMVTHSVLMHGKPPSDAVMDEAIEIALKGISASQ